ncbi:Succinylglutamate desuccinylase / Aspartoacylase family protein [Rubripirellula lacrimiformis]|uniref:Succinylglutamate desuccinylase / Aspartoacylase family protein n=1 Tax=Rubripirellula lacrimiformis TaxID=1930273 RepID=A0A517NGX8_9BACT|nr:succinylglutamate desuccinylase/aspartoacylase family protein [Rubripirellula lacrimiformis]QDT06338.1 Succinylglutamate desuccinylase / Aspartoacylase family protein [Rubripirellula lacrimiformis]
MNRSEDNPSQDQAISPAPHQEAERWFGHDVLPGQSVSTELEITESYSGRTVVIPLRVFRGMQPGPKVFVSAALHGDELNGTGAIRTILGDDSWKLDAGTLLMIPVLNVLGFERHSRYLPDRRDLNRCFPGSKDGSMASRLAKVIFDAIVKRCDYGVDLHTAAVRRTNFPNVRANLDSPESLRIAEAFGTGILLHGSGPKGSLRREATKAGCVTIVVEGGEVWKVESSVAECMSRGIFNVLKELDMMQGEPDLPDSQVMIRETKWLRAERGGFMSMHVAPGDSVQKGQAIATNSSLLAEDQNRLETPFSGIVIGMTTLPAVQPGEPVVHVGRLANAKSVRRHARQVAGDDVQRTAHEHLATNIQVTEPTDQTE